MKSIDGGGVIRLGMPSPSGGKADKDVNGRVNDPELLAYIQNWANGSVSDFDLLEALQTGLNNNKW